VDDGRNDHVAAQEKIALLTSKLEATQHGVYERTGKMVDLEEEKDQIARELAARSDRFLY
jgi:hypothetical protein